MNKKTFIIALAILLAFTILSSPASAMGVGPSQFKIEKAVKGTEYQKTVKIFNTDPTDSLIIITSSGEAASWVSAYPETDLTTAVNNFTLQGGKDILMLLKFRIPETAANGNYTGTLYVQTAPKAGAGMQSVGMNVPIEIKIEVIGEQILEGLTRSITTRDVEINYPLEIKVEFENKGNVVAKPNINVEVKRGSEKVGSSKYTAEAVAPATWKTIPVELDTSSLLPGNYTADVSVLLGEKVVGTQVLSFSLLPLGTMTRAGAFKSLSYTGEPAIGKLLKIVSVFKNTGKISTKANFVGEVYRGGELVDSLKSEEILVAVDSEEGLVSYLKVESAGDYRITGAVLYEGKKTDPRELSFKVEAAAQTTVTTEDRTQPTQGNTATPGTQVDPILFVGIAAVIVLLLALAYVTSRRNKGAETEKGLRRRG